MCPSNCTNKRERERERDEGEREGGRCECFWKEERRGVHSMFDTYISVRGTNTVRGANPYQKFEFMKMIR